MRWNLCALLLLVFPAIAAADPNVAITSPTAAFTKSKTVTATVTGNGALTVEVTVNGGAPTAAVEDPNVPGHFSAENVPLVTQDPLVVGNSTIRVTATDDDGSAFKEVTVTFDDQVPTVDVAIDQPPISDPNGTTQFASLRIAGSTGDNDPNSTPLLFVRGFQVAFAPAAGGFDQRIALATGSNAIVVQRTDRAGNQTRREFHITRTTVCQDPKFPISDPNATPTTYFVDRTDDLPDANLDDDVCDVRVDLRDTSDPNDLPVTPPNRAKCTLRAAIQTANHHPGDDQISLNVSAPIVLTRDGAGDDSAESGDLDVTENVRIGGFGRDFTVIDGRKLGDRVFDVADGVHLQLAKLTVRGGHVPRPTDPNDTGAGGCVRSRGSFATTNVAFLKCKSDARGGALSLEPSLADPNASSALACSIIAQSQSKTDGGAIAVDGSPLTVRNSTLALNSAGGRGGAIFALGGDDPNDVVLSNDTLSQNKAKLAGGALDLGLDASAKINNCTFTKNTAKLGATLSTLDGGQAQISNSILADKKKSCDPNATPPVTSMGGNVEADATCLLAPTTGDQLNTDPKLDKLATNAPTVSTGQLSIPPTHALRIGSPAIDHAGTGPVACEPLDARDVERGDLPHADNAAGSGSASPPFCDAGALETFVSPVP
jgi:CSLREA domain-containing protein